MPAVPRDPLLNHDLPRADKGTRLRKTPYESPPIRGVPGLDPGRVNESLLDRRLDHDRKGEILVEEACLVAQIPGARSRDIAG
jgi:hypothetical protein